MIFLWRILQQRKSGASSKNIAKQRLLGVLVQDRGYVAPGFLEKLKDEIVYGVSKHVEIDRREVELSFAYKRGQSRLVAEVPLKLARDRKSQSVFS